MGIKLSFMGASHNVTGSRYLLTTAKARVLVDCGLFQERENLGLNWENFGFYPGDVDAILITHGHMDHCGWLPKLVKDGFKGPVFCTGATADLVGIILRDIAKIQEEDARTKAKRHALEGRVEERPIRPLYDMSDAEQALKRIQPVERGTKTLVAPGISATWEENGHILGASWIRVETDGGPDIVFSGDVGRWDRPILLDPVPPTHADYLVIESTYGNRVHVHEDVSSQLADILATTAKRGGNVLIPSFSVERAQELLYSLSKLGNEGKLPQRAVYLDSPMAVKVTELFGKHPEVCDAEMLGLIKSGKSPFEFAKLHYTVSAEESKSINRSGGNNVIIAGNGMCTGGRIKHHLAQYIENPATSVVFVGYQAAKTLGRQLLEGAEEIRLFNRRFKVKAQTHMLNSLSGHADREELLRWVSGFTQKPRHCFVTHGDEEASGAFATTLREKSGWEASNPALRDSVDLA